MVQVYKIGKRARLIDAPEELISMLKRIECIADDNTIDANIIPYLQKVWSVVLINAPKPKPQREPNGMYTKLKVMFDKLDLSILTSKELDIVNNLWNCALKKGLTPTQYCLLQNLIDYPEYKINQYIMNIINHPYNHLLTFEENKFLQKVYKHPKYTDGRYLWHIHTKLNNQKKLDTTEKPKLDTPVKSRYEIFKELEARQNLG